MSIFENIKTFDPKDLNERRLRMIYKEDGERWILMGQDLDDNTLYLIHEGEVSSKAPVKPISQPE